MLTGEGGGFPLSQRALVLSPLAHTVLSFVNGEQKERKEKEREKKRFCNIKLVFLVHVLFARKAPPYQIPDLRHTFYFRFELHRGNYFHPFFLPAKGRRAFLH